MLVFGTRPEAIKMGPLENELKKDEEFEVQTVITGQHKEILDEVLKVFNIEPLYNLNMIEKAQGLPDLTSEMLKEITEVYNKEEPDMVLVHGDTATTFASALGAFYNKIPVGHVEAGLRTWDKYAPFPEEMNRQMTDSIADLYFAPTKTSKDNLLKEGKPATRIFVTGNTGIDALDYTVSKNVKMPDAFVENPNNKKILLTMHRRENWGQPMEEVFDAINDLTSQCENIDVIFPSHPNPLVRNTAENKFKGNKRVHIIEPLDVVTFHNVIAQSYFIMTDSGGIQEEAPSLGKPVLVLRKETERPEGVSAGTLKLVGTDQETIINESLRLLNNKDYYEEKSKLANPYGDGKASKRISKALRQYFFETDGKA